MGFLVKEALRRWGKPIAIVSDTHRQKEIMEKLEAVHFPLTSYVTRRNGMIEGSEDLRRFRASMLDGEVHPRRSLLLRNAMSGARTVSDPNGNTKLAKSGEGTRRQRFRDDSAAALLLCVAEGARNFKRRKVVPPMRLVKVG